MERDIKRKYSIEYKINEIINQTKDLTIVQGFLKHLDLTSSLVKIVKIEDPYIIFDNGLKMSYEHNSQCCERHYLSYDDLDFEEIKDLVFDLNNDFFVRPVKDYGIELNAINGFPLRIPGYALNNGYYSSNLFLNFEFNNLSCSVDISNCQEWL